MTPIAQELLGVLRPPPASFFRPISGRRPEPEHIIDSCKKERITADILNAIEKLGRPAPKSEIEKARTLRGTTKGASLELLAAQGTIMRRQIRSDVTGRMVNHYGRAEWFNSKKEAAVITQKRRSERARAEKHAALRALGRPSSLSDIARAAGKSPGSLYIMLKKDPALTRIYSVDDPNHNHPLWWFKETPQ